MADTGYHLGSICVTTPTCADDMLVLDSQPHGLQSTISIIEHYANAEHYIIHPVKSVIVPFNMKSQTELDHLRECGQIQVNGKALPIRDDATHMGIQRSRLSSTSATIEERISVARCTLYALMGSGLHGLNGLPVGVSMHLYETYVQPRALYGLEALIINDTATKELEIFHRRALRPILGLPERTAIAGLYILSGALPIKYMIHRQALNFLWMQIDNELTGEIILRQYATKKNSSASWVIYIKKLLQKYDLPTIIDLLTDLPSKNQWKRLVKEIIQTHANNEICEAASQRSTLRFLNPEYTPRKQHDCISHVDNPHQVTRANIKSRLLLDVYPLETVKLRMQLTKSDLCTLCENGDKEDLKHFLVKCEKFNATRSKYMRKITEEFSTDTRQRMRNDHELCVRLILDPAHFSLQECDKLDPERRPDYEHMTRDYIFAMHIKRTALVK